MPTSCTRRRSLARRALLLAPLVGAAACGPDGGHREPPSFVLITLDTTRADHLGVYGDTDARTPNLDRFAAAARTYTRAYSPSSWTLPSHASLFTGRWPFEHGAGRWSGEGDERMQPLEAHFDTLAELLHAHGYRTAGVAAGSALAPDLGVAQGFDAYDFELSFFGKRAQWVADRALERLAEFGDAPFFLFLNFFDPHTPYKPPGRWKKGLAPVPREITQLLLRAGEPPGEAAPLSPREKDEVAVAREGYDAEIAYMDHQLGRVLEAIAALPQADRTWVVITADHGESFGEHLYLLHGMHLYEDNVHVPLLVHEPGDPRAGTRIDEPVQTQRIFGTLLRAARIPLPAGVDAHHLGEGPVVTALPRTYLAEKVLRERAHHKLRAIYRPPFKLISDPDGDTELYDLSADPRELHDLSEKRPAVVSELAGELADLLKRRPPLYGAEAGKIDERTIDALRAMGYVD